MISDSKANVIKSIALDADVSETHFNRRDSEIKKQKHQFIVSAPLNKADLTTIKEQLGNWIILKTRMNTPWWSPLRKKPEVLFADDKLISRANYMLKENGDIILQKLITDSVDNQGHFGELRVYYMIAR